MPLIVATNAYVTRDEADAYAYFLTQLHSSGWIAANNDDRERALIAATAAVDRLGFNGMIASHEQRLAWPRIRMRDREGRTIASDIVPEAVKAATCEYALHLLTNPKATEHTPAIAQKRVGDLELRYRATSPDPVPLPVRQLLAPFLRVTAHSAEMVP